jgi:DnaJ-class molecular chaperone
MTTKDAATERCQDCGGHGDKFILPRGNPFHMRLPQLARALVKVRCFHCNGTGRAALGKART